MKFLVTYRERKSDLDPASAQRRVARTMRAMPAGLKVHQLLTRIEGGGGYAVVEAAEAGDLQQFASLFSAYDCRIEPVMDRLLADVAPAHPIAGPHYPPHARLPEMPPEEPHEGAFSDDDVYDTED